MTRRFLFLLQSYILGILLILISSISSYVQPVNELEVPLIKSYFSKEYKEAPRVFGIIQDTNGIVYFTRSVITEFDGDTWEKTSPLFLTTNFTLKSLWHE